MEKIKMPFVGKYPVTQKYGVKVKYMRAGIHTGIDWGLPKGTPLLASFAGKVIKAERWQLNGYGREIQIQRADGLIAQYAHCSEIFVEVGNEVESGTILGKSGNTGYVISLGGGGYHLHFGTMIDKKWFDPETIIEGHSLPIEIPRKIEVKNMDEPVKTDTQIHTVEKGDTLSKLAQMYLGNGNQWRQIFELNTDTISNPNKIKIGQKIKIPKKNASNN